jgi:hypothetical protein
MSGHEQDPIKIEELQKAHRLKKRQEKIRADFSILKNTSTKYFQSEFVRVQAEEICRYVAEMQLTPLNPWYSKLQEMVNNGPFMSQFYLTLNEFGTIVPDYEKIKTLILPDPTPEDFPRSSLGMI